MLAVAFGDRRLDRVYIHESCDQTQRSEFIHRSLFTSFPGGIHEMWEMRGMGDKLRLVQDGVWLIDYLGGKVGPFRSGTSQVRRRGAPKVQDIKLEKVFNY